MKFEKKVKYKARPQALVVELLSFLETHLLVVERPYLKQEDLIIRYTLIHLIIIRYTKKIKWCFVSSWLNVSLSWSSPSISPIIFIIGGLIQNFLCYRNSSLYFISIPRGTCRCRFRLFYILDFTIYFLIFIYPF